MWWIKFCESNLQCFWQYLTSGKFTRPKHIENEQACFTMVNFSISFKQILPNLQSCPAEGSRCYRGPFMVLFWCLWYTSTFTIVAKIVFRFSRGLKRRTGERESERFEFISQTSFGFFPQRKWFHLRERNSTSPQSPHLTSTKGHRSRFSLTSSFA